jgi:hypothetical protein
MALQPNIHAPYRAGQFSMLAFQAYQIAFTAHIRNPRAHKKPAKVNDKRMAVYREIVFNNIMGSVSACYPVCQQCLGKRAWQRLVRGFFADYAATSPIFRDIPSHFLDYLQHAKNLPAYLTALAHYEWVELALSAQVTETPNVSEHHDCLDEIPVLAPAHQLLAYDFPVHQISARFKPTEKLHTFLLVFRHANHQVKFIELNPITFQLLSLIQEKHLTGRQALVQITAAMQHPDVNVIVNFGAEILADLAHQGAIIGNQKAP